MNGKTVEIKDKWLLTVEEAAAYFGIGTKKIRALSEDGIDQGWALKNGSKVLIKRVKFQEWLDGVCVI